MENFLLLDVETGGLDPKEHSLLSIGACVLTPTGVESAYDVLIKHPVYHLTAGALNVNKLRVDVIDADGVSVSDAVLGFMDFIERYFSTNAKVRVMGVNPSFDMAFMRELFNNTSVTGARDWFERRISHRVIDLYSLFAVVNALGIYPIYVASFDDVLKYFESKGAPALPAGMRHTALGDAVAAGTVYTLIMQDLHSMLNVAKSTPST